MHVNLLVQLYHSVALLNINLVICQGGNNGTMMYNVSVVVSLSNNIYFSIVIKLLSICVRFV